MAGLFPCFCASVQCMLCSSFFFFFNDTATTEIYTLSLHDALPILARNLHVAWNAGEGFHPMTREDRKSTRLNSSHPSISYAVFCLKKKKQKKQLEPNPVSIPTTSKDKLPNHP